MNDAADYTGKDAPDGAAGIVYASPGGYIFQFTVLLPLERNEFIQFEHPSYGWVLCRVEDIRTRNNLSIEATRSIASGREVPYTEMEIGTGRIIGVADGHGGIAQIRQPVPAGTRIFRAENALLSEVLGLSRPGRGLAHVGTLFGRDMDVFLSIEEMVQKHTSIIAKTGGGKSYLAGVILEEMMKNGVTVLILDPHGEYGALAKTAGVEVASPYATQICEFAVDTEVNRDARPLRFTLSNFSASDLLTFTPSRDSRGNLALLEGAMEMLKEAGNYSISDLAEVVRERHPDALSLLSALKELEALGVFSREGTHMDEIVVRGKTCILNFRGAPPEVQSIFARRILTAIFELRKRDRLPPVFIVLEEAHNFCPQTGRTESSQIIRTIAAEGRKFGVGLLVITQRAAKVDKNVLSQCNTQFILKLTNANDLKAVAASAEGMTSELEEEIPRLETGVAVAMGGGLPLPVLLRVRARETADGGRGTSIVEECDERDQ